MTTHLPTVITPTEMARPPALAPSPGTRFPGSWRYDCPRRSRRTLALAILISAALHAGLLVTGGRARKKPAPAPVDTVLAVALVMPEVEELEEPEPSLRDDADSATDAGVPVPMQQDLPQLPQPSDFVQPLNFASLLDQPDFSRLKLLSIPENIRRGGKPTDGLGNIFNLADLDRAPEPVFQPPPVIPTELRRAGLSATVRLEFVVDANGRVFNASVVESTDHRFDHAALTGVAKWKFKPGMKAGRRVSTRMAVPIVFTLE